MSNLIKVSVAAINEALNQVRAGIGSDNAVRIQVNKGQANVSASDGSSIYHHLIVCESKDTEGACIIVPGKELMLFTKELEKAGDETLMIEVDTQVTLRSGKAQLCLPLLTEFKDVAIDPESAKSAKVFILSAPLFRDTIKSVLSCKENGDDGVAEQIGLRFTKSVLNVQFKSSFALAVARDLPILKASISENEVMDAILKCDILSNVLGTIISDKNVTISLLANQVSFANGTTMVVIPRLADKQEIVAYDKVNALIDQFANGACFEIKKQAFMNGLAIAGVTIGNNKEKNRVRFSQSKDGLVIRSSDGNSEIVVPITSADGSLEKELWFNFSRVKTLASTVALESMAVTLCDSAKHSIHFESGNVQFALLGIKVVE